MKSKSINEKSAEKIKLLRDAVVSAAFLHYFNRNFQAQQVLTQLQAAGADVQYLREWALYSIHGLGADEAEEKSKRGRLGKIQLKRALVGYENAIAFYSQYATAAHFGWPESKNVSSRFQDLVDRNQYLARETSAMLERIAAGSVYTTKRLGVNWNAAYLYVIKEYIRKFTGWDERKIFEAMTHLIAAAYKSLRNRIPSDLRSLVRKATRKFETDPKNATIVGRMQRAVADPSAITAMFPSLIPKPI
jgi:hypothetical protein